MLTVHEKKIKHHCCGKYVYVGGHCEVLNGQTVEEIINKKDYLTFF